mmetsp:Transcript_11798/g.36475  ORF Transcript_11798/g.36475 Transcript_11798/m.36475 type:complete len:258 (+) Transcript_11798:774-1547(+)
MPQLHFAKVALQLVLAFEERQVELAKVELFAVVVLLGEGRKVPRVDLPAPQLNLLDVLDLGVLLVLAQRCLVKLRVVVVLVVILAELALLRARLVFVAALLSLIVLPKRVPVEPVGADPLVIAAVELRVVHVVLPFALELPALKYARGAMLAVAPRAHRARTLRKRATLVLDRLGHHGAVGRLLGLIPRLVLLAPVAATTHGAARGRQGRETPSASVACTAPDASSNASAPGGTDTFTRRSLGTGRSAAGNKRHTAT